MVLAMNGMALFLWFLGLYVFIYVSHFAQKFLGVLCEADQWQERGALIFMQKKAVSKHNFGCLLLH